MKGLALILSPKGPKGAGLGKSPVADKPESAEGDERETGSSKKEFARLASEAIADGDHDAASDALVSLVEACTRSYGPKA